MFDTGCLLSLYAETPVHCGSGSTFGAIDLPVQREKHTNLPIVPASSIKGVLRDVARHKHPKDPAIDEVFGPEDDGNLHAGAISPTDGRLLLFPVRSSVGVFVWATSPFILRRLQRDFSLARMTGLNLAGIDKLQPSDQKALVVAGSEGPGQIVLEEDEFVLEPDSGVQTLVTALGEMLPLSAGAPEYDFIRRRLSTNVVVIADDHLVRLASTQTDIVTRNRLNEQKTTTGGVGNMWIQEYLPSDALFYSVVLATGSRKEDTKLGVGAAILSEAKRLADVTHVQIGGDETVGRGWMRVTWVGA